MVESARQMAAHMSVRVTLDITALSVKIRDARLIRVKIMECAMYFRRDTAVRVHPVTPA